MRIVHVITRFIRGGADENTLYSCNGQAAQGHEVLLVHGAEYDEALRSRLDARVEVVRLPSLHRAIHPWRDLQAWGACVRLFREWQPDIVHTHTSKASIVGRWAAWCARVPVIIYGIHILPHINEGWLQRHLYLWIERGSALITGAFVNVGQDMMDQAIRDGIGPAERHVMIPSGMDLQRFTVARERPGAWREALGEAAKGLPENPRFLVLVSRLEQRKGQLAFLEVFERVARRVPEAVLLLVGEGPDQEILETRVRELKLQGRVVLTGFRPDVERLLAIADVGVLASRREGLPRVIIQYALAGLPVVATDIPGVREMIEPGVNGFTAPPDDLAAMEVPIVRLLTNEPFRQEFAGRVRAKDFSAWSIDTMVSMLEALYRKQLATRTPSIPDMVPVGLAQQQGGKPSAREQQAA